MRSFFGGWGAGAAKGFHLTDKSKSKTINPSNNNKVIEISLDHYKYYVILC